MRAIIYLSLCCGLLFACKKALFNPNDNFRLKENRNSGISCDPSDAEPERIIDFDTDHTLCVQITMEPNDLEEMRHQSSLGESTQKPEDVMCVAVSLILQCKEPWPNYYTWFPGDIALDGITLQEVGIRKKGFLGSIFSNAPSMKISTGHYHPNLQFSTVRHFTLNNNTEDPSRLLTSLVYEIFAAANYPAPRTQLANVMVNGEPMGAYTNVEPINERFLERYFGTHDGDLYEGQVVDFQDDWIRRWEAETPHTNSGKGQIRAVAAALQAPEEDLLEALDEVVNLERYYTFWALEVLTGHGDGYAANRNNFYIYCDPLDQNRVTFLPWGVGSFQFAIDSPVGLERYVAAEIPRRLSRNTVSAAIMEQRLDSLLNLIWDEAHWMNRIEHFAAQVRAIEDQPDHAIAVGRVRDWVQERRGVVQAMLEEGLPEGRDRPWGCITR